MTPSLGLHFVRPYWLWALLPLLPAALWWWRRQRRRGEAWRRRVDPHLLPHLLQPASGRSGAARVVLGPAVVTLTIVALAGPGWRLQPQPLWLEAAPLVIALDLSSATSAEDLPPSRLLQARAAIDRLLRARTGGQVALVAFAGDAHTVAPLTDDVDNVRVFLDALAPDIMPTDGSRPEHAIAWSVRLLRQAGFKHGDILVLTHDASVAARRQAAAASRDGYAVSVLGIGTPEGAAHRDSVGRLTRSRLDADALRALAAAGSGRYLALAGQPGDAELLELVRGTGTGSARAGDATIRADQGYWLLLPLMLLAALAFRRGSIVLLLVLSAALCLPPAPAQAQDGGLWRRADQARHDRAMEAVEAYRHGDFNAAARIWAELPGADAAYNRGNALARAGHLQEALDAYDEALALQPGMEDAMANREVVEQALQQPPPQGEGGGEQQSGDSDDHRDSGSGAQQGGAGAMPGDQGDSGEVQPADPESGDGEDYPSSDERQAAAGQDAAAQADPVDADRQQQADEALHEQVQRALEERGEGDGAEQPAAAGTADVRERERREAAEAWLQRIPDDPGGLLRERFRLEHERRLRGGAD